MYDSINMNNGLELAQSQALPSLAKRVPSADGGCFGRITSESAKHPSRGGNAGL